MYIHILVFGFIKLIINVYVLIIMLQFFNKNILTIKKVFGN